MNAKEILEKNSLSATRIRVTVLNLFDSTGKAYSMPALLKSIANCNRITLYRTLKCFVQKKILLQVSAGSNHPIYMLSPLKDTFPDQRCKAFCICRKCHKTISFHAQQPDTRELSGNFIIEEERLILDGLCIECSRLSHNGTPDNVKP